jgi:sulfotransferase
MSAEDEADIESGPAVHIRPTYRIHDGMRMPLGFPPEGFASGQAYRPAEGDVFVASYPKSGTTWLQYIVYLLIRGRPISPDESLTDCFPHLEEVGADAVARQPLPRLIKTHLPFGMTPCSAGARYLAIARNPFDCAVSFYHHTRGFPRHYDFAEGRFEEFFDCFITGEVDFGDYFDHLTSWHAASKRDNVRLLTYEALWADTPGMIRHVASFLGEPAASAVATDAGLEAVRRESDFRAMRRDQQRWSSRRPDWAPAFVRRGVVGDWRRVFTREQTRALLAKFDRRLAGTGLEALWPDVLAEARAFAATG